MCRRDLCLSKATHGICSFEQCIDYDDKRMAIEGCGCIPLRGLLRLNKEISLPKPFVVILHAQGYQ